ncbi:DUF11 domain-containing protein, partial [Dermatophilus congolensis]
MTQLLSNPSLRRTLANITALKTTLALITLTVLCGIHAPTPAAHAAPTNTGTSSDNAITVTTTATPASIPPGGSQVSMAYTVTNNTAERAYLVSMLDNKCPAVRQTSGLKTDSIRWYIEPGKTANFSCNFFAGIALDATITATFTTYNTTNTWHESSAQATTTVTLATNQCDTLWYSSLLNNSDTGRIGTLGTQPNSAIQPRWTISQLTNSVYDSSAALDVNPVNPNHIYFIPSKAGNSYGGLWRLDTNTGTATRITTNTTATTSVRLAADRNGTLWSWATNGILYSLAPGTTTWTAHTLTAASSTDGRTTLTADQIKNLGAGDLVTSGNGDLWLLAANTGTNTTYLLSINANESTKPTPTPVIVGLMNRPTDGGFYTGLAFSSTGKLLASAGAASSTTATNTLYEVDIATGQATRISAAPSAGNGSIGDLGSCAQPLSRLHLIKRADTPNPAVKPGDTITYEIEARNLGGMAAVDVRLQESIPAGTTYLPGSTTLNGTKIADTNGTMPYTNTREIHANNTTRAGIIPAFSTATIRFTVTVNNTSPQTTNITNQATLTSTTYTNGLLSDDPSAPGSTDPTSVRIARPAITIDKTANTPAITGSGPITYTYTVANIGAEPLAGITLTDNATRGATPITPYACTSPTLTNGDANKDTILDIYETWTYTCTDTLTWSTTDTDSGTTITNTATVTGTGETSGSTVTSTSALTTALKPQPAYINITKQPGTVVGPDSDTGEMVASYSVLVSNTGQANGSYSTLTDTPNPPAGMKVTAVEWVRLDGETVTGSGIAPSDGNGGYLLNTTPRPLPGGATERYRVRIRLLWTNSTIPLLTCDQGSGIRNTAALPTGEENAPTNDNTTCLDAPHPPQPAIALVKTGTPPAAATAGSTIPYTFTVTNNSPNIFLTDLTITDPLISDITCDNNRLSAGTTTTCRGNYTITTTDLNAGKITNTATASALPAGFDPTNRITTTATNTLPVNSTAALTLNKTATAQDPSALTTNAAVGDRITYTFTITNSGNKTLHQPTIDDPILGITNKPCGTGDLAIGDTTSCTATYALTKADIDRGRLTNIATATALGTAGGTDDPAPITDSATATLTGIAGKTGLWLEKSQLGTVIDADNSGDHSAGDTLWYTFRVRNLTTATITGITVTDTKAGSTVTCDETTLEVGASTACRLSNPYRITTADLTAGKVINVATATADGGLTSNQPSVTTLLTYNPTLTLTKIAGALTEATITPDTPAGPSKGDTITYSFTVTNPTALPMTNLTITDPLLPSITCTNPTGATTTTIQARETLTCTAAAPYTITRPDIDARH